MPQFEVEVSFTNTDGGHFTYEEDGLFTLYSIVLVMFVILLSSSLVKYYREMKKTDKVDSPMLVLSIAILLELISIIFQFFHLLKYSYDGRGIAAFDILSIMIEISSQFCVTLLLILISWGWY